MRTLINLSIIYIACIWLQFPGPRLDDRPLFSSNQFNSQKLRSKEDSCNYLEHFKRFGNRKTDTFMVDLLLRDPIDDSLSFQATKFGFYLKGDTVFKKAVHTMPCNGQLILVEYFQDFTGIINLETYKDLEAPFFINKGKVFFWYPNSEGFIIVPINGADPKSFVPFKDVCGGYDNKAVYYGGPGLGVDKLDIPVDAQFEFVAKPNAYWNSPDHYVLIEGEVYDIKYSLELGYHCVLKEELDADEIRKKYK